LIDESKVVHGGNSDENEKYIEPTIIINATDEDKCMKEEIFGPILPLVTVKDHNDAIDYINNQFVIIFFFKSSLSTLFILQSEKPLALYVFSKNDQIYNEFLNRTSSGSFALNDVLIQCARN
jgi:acyl-CoA reductase-like NAD-dependent aldehyde dehydrogenase